MDDENAAQTVGHLPSLACDCRKPAYRLRTTSDAHIRVTPLIERIILDQGEPMGGRKRNARGHGWNFLVEDRAEPRPFNGVQIRGVLDRVKPRLPRGAVGLTLKLPHRPHFYFRNLENVEHAHGNSVGPLICEMSLDAHAEHLVCLSDIDRLMVVVVKCVDAKLTVADHAALVVKLI